MPRKTIQKNLAYDTERQLYYAVFRQDGRRYTRTYRTREEAQAACRQSRKTMFRKKRFRRLSLQTRLGRLQRKLRSRRTVIRKQQKRLQKQKLRKNSRLKRRRLKEQREHM